MAKLPCPSPLSIFAVSTIDHGAGDDELDRSLFYSYSLIPQSRSTVNVLKGLSLAARGVLDSICGEKTRAIRLKHQGNSPGLVLAVAHLQVCMVSLVLPDQFSDSHASQLVAKLAQTMVLLAGASPQWLEDRGNCGGKLMLRRHIQMLLDRVSEGFLRQLDSSNWIKLIPSLVFEGTLYLHINADQQQQLEALVKPAKQLEATGTPTASKGNRGASGVSGFQFYRRSSCLMYRGVMLFSELPPEHTRLLWQLCWALGLLSQASGLPCQVLTHKLHLASASSLALELGDCPDEDATLRSPTCCVVLVAACNLVMAHLLDAYDEDIEEDIIGKLEGQGAVSLLHRLHVLLGLELDRAVEASAAYSSLARLGGWGGGQEPGSHAGTPRGGPSKGMGSPSLLRRIMAKHKASSQQQQGAAGPGPGLGQGRPLHDQQSCPATPAKHGAEEQGGMGSGLGLGFGQGMGSPRMSAPSSPTGAVGPRGNAEELTMLLAFDAGQGRVEISGDVADAALLPAVWSAVEACRARLSASKLAVAMPPKHSRLCMTVEQIEQLAASRSQREGGQRLGTADSAPWLYHPELAAVAGATQFSVKVTPSMAALPWYVTACLTSDGKEVYLLHSGAVDEAQALDSAMLPWGDPIMLHQ